MPALATDRPATRLAARIPRQPAGPQAPVFSAPGQPLTRSGIYKIVRRHAASLDDPRTGRRISPHTFRHTAVHQLGRRRGQRDPGPARALLSPSPTAGPRSLPEPSPKPSAPWSYHTLRSDPVANRSGGPTSPSSTGSPPCEPLYGRRRQHLPANHSHHGPPAATGRITLQGTELGQPQHPPRARPGRLRRGPT
jgi:hypothetical protein